MASKGFAKADRTQTQVAGKRKKASAAGAVAGIPASDHTEREKIIERLKNPR